jgi:hypothetical protein
MKNRPTSYPDISDILARKAAGRREHAVLSFAEKLDIVDSLKRQIEPLVQVRKTRVARRRRSSPH